MVDLVSTISSESISSSSKLLSLSFAKAVSLIFAGTFLHCTSICYFIRVLFSDIIIEQKQHFIFGIFDTDTTVEKYFLNLIFFLPAILCYCHLLIYIYIIIYLLIKYKILIIYVHCTVYSHKYFDMGKLSEMFPEILY